MPGERFDELVDALKEDSQELVKDLLHKDQDLLHTEDVDGWQILHHCAVYGSPSMMKMLIEEFKADVNQRTAYGNTPAMLGIEWGKMGCLVELMRHGADMEADNRGGETIIDCMVHHIAGTGPVITNCVDYPNNVTLVLEGDDDIVLKGENTHYVLTKMLR
jgi:ankyrin repeat protein